MMYLTFLQQDKSHCFVLVSIGILHLHKGTPMIYLWFCALHHNPDSQQIQKSPMIFGLSRYSNSYLSTTTGLISSIKVSIESPGPAEEDSLGPLRILIFAPDPWYWESSKKRTFLILLGTETHTFLILKLWFFSNKVSTESIINEVEESVLKSMVLIRASRSDHSTNPK